MDKKDANDIARALAEAQYGNLERRMCSAASPMAMAEKDNFRWGHPDAKELREFFNLIVCECPHCGLVFTCLPRSEPPPPDHWSH